jgi:hypothetical protein
MEEEPVDAQDQRLALQFAGEQVPFRPEPGDKGGLAA